MKSSNTPAGFRKTAFFHKQPLVGALWPGDHYVPALEDGLTGKSGGGRYTFRKLDAVGFGLFHGREVFHAGFNVEMAGGAGAVSAALVLEVDSIIQQRIKERIAGARF